MLSKLTPAVLTFILALGAAGCASSGIQSAAAPSASVCAQLEASGASPEEIAKRGCCSHHGGVCGCNQGTGMQRCCDGADSPSCVCGE